MNNEESIRRAERAKQLLADPLIHEAFETIDRDIIDQWGACPVRDVEGREMLWRLHMTSLKFKAIFEGFIQNGKVAELREKQSATDKMVKLFRGASNG